MDGGAGGNGDCRNRRDKIIKSIVRMERDTVWMFVARGFRAIYVVEVAGRPEPPEITWHRWGFSVKKWWLGFFFSIIFSCIITLQS